MNKQNGYACVLFDWENVLVRRLPAPAEQLNRALEYYGVPQPMERLEKLQAWAEENIARQAAENGTVLERKRLLWHVMAYHASRLFPGCPSVRQLAAFPQAAESYTLREGAWDVLIQLKQRGVKTGMITHAADACEQAAEELMLTAFADCMIHAGENGVSEACKRLGANAKETLYVGAYAADALRARKAGVDYARLMIHPQTEEKEHLPVYKLNTLQDLLGIVAGQPAEKW